MAFSVDNLQTEISRRMKEAGDRHVRRLCSAMRYGQKPPLCQHFI